MRPRRSPSARPARATRGAALLFRAKATVLQARRALEGLARERHRGAGGRSLQLLVADRSRLALEGYVAGRELEHRPVRLLEAVARGIPVVATEACGLRGVTGVVEIPTGDLDALRDALSKLANAGTR